MVKITKMCESPSTNGRTNILKYAQCAPAILPSEANPAFHAPFISTYKFTIANLFCKDMFFFYC